MTTWTKQKISDIVIEKVIRYTPTSAENLPYIGLEHIEEGSLKLNSIGNSDEVKSQKKKFYKGDILYGSLRPYFRKVIKANFDGVSSTDITILKPKENINRDFLFYLIASQEFINKASMASNGTKMPRAGWKIVKDFSFGIPEPRIQSKIGLILSTYDDLIENNEKRIRILEEMAQRLYTQWFVKFGFPGHEKVKMVNSGTKFGLIPKGWEVKKVKDLYNTSSGGTPSRKNETEFYEDGSILWVKTKELNDSYILDTEEKISEIALKKSSAKLFPENTVLVAMYGATIGKLGILSEESTTNQACCAFLLRNELFSSYYIFQFLKDNIKKLISLAFGGAQPNVSQTTIGNLLILKPANDILNTFNGKAEALFREILLLQKQVKNLSVIRDLLIPRLVTGRKELN